jgi:hypothetical protein
VLAGAVVLYLQQEMPLDVLEAGHVEWLGIWPLAIGS